MQDILESLKESLFLAKEAKEAKEDKSSSKLRSFNKARILESLIKMRSFLIDLMVSIQEQALYESNKPSSHASSLSDELGSLIELVTT